MFGEMETCVMDGGALPMVTLFSPAGPSTIPSLGVTLSVHTSPLLVLLLGRVVLVCEVLLPLSSQL